MIRTSGRVAAAILGGLAAAAVIIAFSGNGREREPASAEPDEVPVAEPAPAAIPERPPVEPPAEAAESESLASLLRSGSAATDEERARRFAPVDPASIIGRGPGGGAAGSGQGGGGCGSGFGTGGRPQDGGLFGVLGIVGVRRFVYVLDRSDAAAPFADIVKTEIARRLRRLSPGLRFDITWSGGAGPDHFAGRLVTGVEENQKLLFRHLEETPFRGPRGDGSAVIDALERSPELVVFVTSSGLSREEVGRITAANAGKAKKAQINVIALIADGTSPEGLEALAKGNGGRYRVLRRG